MNKKNVLLNKVASVGLSIMMLGSAALLPISAKTFSDVTPSHEYRDQIDLLSDIGVIHGTSENEFSPDLPVSREQMALLLYRFMMAGRNNAGTVNGTAFRDLYDPTYSGAITWANATGYIIGTSPVTFEPKAGITLQDAMTMVVRALGYNSLSMQSGYPWTYIDTATKLGLDNGLEKIPYTQNLTRGQVALLLYNGLGADYLVERKAGMTTTVEKSTVLEEIFGYAISPATLVATDSIALEGHSVASKTGSVVLIGENGENRTVPFSSLGLSGEAEERLGQTLRVIERKKTGGSEIVGAAVVGRVEAASIISFASDEKTVTIDGTRYQVVKEKNENRIGELTVYAFGSDGTLKKLGSTAELKKATGFGLLQMIYDTADSDTASAAILKNSLFAQMTVKNGKINLADGLSAKELTGGLVNPSGASDGDYVLYYFNKALNRLEILEKLEVSDKEMISRVGSDSAVIGEKTYSIGMPASGADPSDIRDALLSVGLGNKTRVVAKNNVILAVVSDDAPVKAASEYLLALSEPTAVYTGGMLRHVMTVFTDGMKQDVFVPANAEVTVGRIYRFEKDVNGVTKLIGAGEDAFAQENEIAHVYTKIASDVAVEKIGAGYAVGDVRFVTDENTVVWMNDGEKLTAVRGEITSTIRAKAGSDAVMVLSDEVGSVKTLAFLYLSNGSVDNAETTDKPVLILSKIGYEYVNGSTLSVYSVLNLLTGQKEELGSVSSALENGKVYALDSLGLISSDELTPITGKVNGYTKNTVTIGDATYVLTADSLVVTLSESGELTAVAPADLYENEVVVTLKGNAVVTMIAKEATPA